MIYPEDRSKKTIFVDAIDDDKVEILYEYLTLTIIDVTDENVYIDEVKNTTELIIVDDDGKYITCVVYCSMFPRSLCVNELDKL